MADHPLAASVDFLARPTQEQDSTALNGESGNGSSPVTIAARVVANSRPSLHGRARSDVFGDALDLADPVRRLSRFHLATMCSPRAQANRLGTSPDINSVRSGVLLSRENISLIQVQRIEQKRLEHERQRAAQKVLFDEQVHRSCSSSALP